MAKPKITNKELNKELLGFSKLVNKSIKEVEKGLKKEISEIREYLSSEKKRERQRKIPTSPETKEEISEQSLLWLETLAILIDKRWIQKAIANRLIWERKDTLAVIEEMKKIEMGAK